MDFFDKIDALIVSGASCQVIYTEDGAQKLVNGAIDDLVGEKGEELLVLTSGQQIRFDRVMKIDGVISPFLC